MTTSRCITADGLHDWESVGLIDRFDDFDLMAAVCLICGAEEERMEPRGE